MEEQAANALIARDTANLQNQMTRAQLADQAQERRLMNEEFPLIDSYMKGVREYELNPEANQLPQKPSVRSLTYRAQIDQLDNRIKEITPAYEAMQVKKRIFENKMQMRLNELKEADRLSRESGIDITIPMQNDPLGIGVGVDPIKKSMALQRTRGLYQAKAFNSPQDYIALPDEELVNLIPGYTVDQISAARANGTLTDIIASQKNLPTAAMRNTNEFIDNLTKLNQLSGVEMDEKTIQAFRTRMQGLGGRLREAPEKTRQAIDNQFAVLETIDDFRNRIRDFEERNPGRKFSEFLGIIPRKYTDTLALFEEEKDPVRREALEIAADFQGIRNGVLATRSGLTVTAGEDQRLSAEIGSLNDKNMLVKLDRFRSKQERALRDTLARNAEYMLGDYYTQYYFSKPGTSPLSINTTPSMPQRGPGPQLAPITKAKALQIFREAGGNKARAEELARQQGFDPEKRAD